MGAFTDTKTKNRFGRRICDAGQTTVRRSRRAGRDDRRGREQDVAEISRGMYEKIRSSRDPRDNVEDG